MAILKPAMGAPLRHSLLPQLQKPKIRGVDLERVFPTEAYAAKCPLSDFTGLIALVRLVPLSGHIMRRRSLPLGADCVDKRFGEIK
jgi:hypothetical protein